MSPAPSYVAREGDPHVLRLFEVAALVLFVLCTALLLLIRGTRLVVVFLVEALVLVAVAAGVVSYVLGGIGVL